MEVMYLKYTHGIRHSIIKEGENIIMTDSKVLPFKPTEKVEVKEYTPTYNSTENIITFTCNDKLNEEITAFFFDSIHKNYLSNRKNL